VRLKQIKLAGFKSFVDPTSFEVPSQLVGVVGPNGCGKSNIIDAVRWVLGESRASELRGESMQDVIFNGSDQRKPASRASVELVFDNALGRVGGTWGTYAEIAVKRILTRDGQSIYSINNQAVRRKDVHDIFLGTGLGPRAYAIIGQGTISRIIEARPEDLRIFLEEAAGVSKYKERRRETENRLSDTRENLVRVDDILRELNNQLEKLERQAQVAQQFKELEADRDCKQKMLWLLRRDEATAERDRLQAQVAAAQTELEQATTELRSLDTQLESVREAQFAAGDKLHSQQALYYEKNSTVARLEAEIRMVVDSRNQVNAQLAMFASQTADAQGRQSFARQEVEQLATQLEEAAEREEQLSAELEQAESEIEPVEAAVAKADAEVEAARTQATEVSKAIEVSAARQSAARRQIESLSLRLDRARQERKQVEVPELTAVERAVAIRDSALKDEELSLIAMNEAESKWRGLEVQRTPAQESLRGLQTKTSQIEARISALKQLQERAQSQAKVVPWLQKHGLDKLGRLWQKMQIESGWETAVESVLRDRVSALEVGSLELISKLSHDAPPGKAAFYSASIEAKAVVAAIESATPLAKMVRSNENRLNQVMVDWLANIYCADSLDEAMQKARNHAPGIVFVTKQGHQVTRSGIQFHAAENEQEGVLARQHELESLTKEHRAQQLLADEERSRVSILESSAQAALTAFSQLREKHAGDLRALGQVRVEAERLEQQAARSNESVTRLESLIEEINAELQGLHEEESQMQEQFEMQDVALGEKQQSLEDKREVFFEVQARLEKAKQRLRDLERTQQETSFQKRALSSRREQLVESDRGAADLLMRTAGQVTALTAQLAQLNESADQAGLQTALEDRVAAETALSQARNAVEEANQQLRQAEEKRLAIERSQEPLRTKVNEVQLKEQAARLNIEQFAVQLEEVQADEAVVRAAFESTPKIGYLQGEMTRLAASIANLGPVNLAALDELTQSRERQNFLTAQMADLNEAITTLEDAIKKIDLETRALLQDTYDKVNEGFGVLFPKLFGGGEAKLTLTGDEILNAGVQVMAQPPGKRNATIHLLSGGEKALTAIALVFAMFKLNPAPFCLLDEVDAPLDDANTERYANIVREMADQTQFLFITHNKIAMELAQQLIGVTMQEKGVSRIVAVDLEDAARMLVAA
jgi:chromosome segregation protein